MLIRPYTCPTQGCHFEWHLVTLSELAKYSMSRSIVRLLCNIWTSCALSVVNSVCPYVLLSCSFLSGNPPWRRTERIKIKQPWRLTTERGLCVSSTSRSRVQRWRSRMTALTAEEIPKMDGWNVVCVIDTVQAIRDQRSCTENASQVLRLSQHAQHRYTTSPSLRTSLTRLQDCFGSFLLICLLGLYALGQTDRRSSLRSCLLPNFWSTIIIKRLTLL